jgi:type I restriction enzyme S subunit
MGSKKRPPQGTGIVPRLRFPEFAGAGGWEESELGSFTTILKGKGIAKSDIAPDGGRLCIRYGELYTRYGEVIDTVYSRTDLPDSELFLSRKNDVIIPSSGETKTDIATAACVLLDDVALGSDLNVLRTNQNGVFLSYLLNGPIRNEIAKIAQGDTVAHLYPSQLKGLAVAMPGLAEQRKIASCLTTLDELISAESRKLDLLKSQKKGLLQKLFPKEGESVPRLRFAEFEGAGEWETIAFPDAIRNNCVSRENQIPSTEIKPIGKFPVIDQSQSFIAGYSDEKLRVIRNDLPLVVFGDHTRVVKFVDFQFILGGDGTKVLKAREDLFDPIFFCYAIQSLNIPSLGYNRHFSLLKERELSKPTLPEQHKIASCLSSLDEIISAQTQKLDLLNKHKKGLMLQLFPTLLEA